MSGALRPVTLGKYQIRGELGRGAMGVVYDGWDPDIDRRVAVKAVRFPPLDDEGASETIARFRREPKAAGRLNHPNIVGVYDYGETEDGAFIVLEFVAGRTLQKALAAHERIHPDRAISLMQDVLAGLAYSHDQGVLHRDMKPANIIVTDDGRAKIADFGIARIESSSLTQPGTVMGTPAYMSPEQLTGEPLDQRTDIYSCGVILFELLTGERLFDGSIKAIMHKALNTTPPRPSELSVTAPLWLDTVVARAMARRPDDRFSTAAEFAAALRLYSTDMTTRQNATAAAIPDPAATVLGHPVTGARPEGSAASFRAQSVDAEGVADPGATVVGSFVPPVGNQASGRSRGWLPLILGGVLGVAALGGMILYTFQIRQNPSSPAPRLVPDTQRQQTNQPSDLSPLGTQQQALPSQPSPPTPTASSSAPLPPTLSSPTPLLPATGRPAIDAAAIENALAGRLASARCSLTKETTNPNGVVTIFGIVGAGQAEVSLRREVAASGPTETSWRVVSFDGPYCPALDLIRPFGDVRAGQRARLEFEQIGGPTPLRDNDIIPVRLTMPDFVGYLHIAYLQHDSTVAQQVPSVFYPQRAYVARQTIEFGRNGPDFDGWRVGPPFGVDMILAVASTAPLFPSPLPDSQAIGPYLSSLQAAAENLRRRGGSVAAAAILIDTRDR